MSTKLQKMIQEVESQKLKMQSLVLGKQDAQIVEAGCKGLQALSKLHSQFKGQISQQAIIQENFIGIYHHLLTIANIYAFDEFENIIDSKVIRLFGENLKDIHYFYAVQAKKQNQDLLLEYHLRKAAQLMPTDANLCQNLSQYYMDKSDLTNAFLALKHYQGPFNPVIFCQNLYCLNKMCDFKALEKEIPKLKALIEQGDTSCIMLFLKWIGLDNATVYQASKNYQKTYEGKQENLVQLTRECNKKIRLAYIGSNFISHAQSTQFGSSFFVDHPDNFEIYLYSLRGNGASDKEKQLKKQVSRYIHLEDIGNEEAIEMIRKDQIDIIVNCNGHADDRRPYEILHRRVAPIQIDYLGYPGTSGANYIDYYIGDPISTPLETLGPYFTEKLILLPHTYQVTEHATSYNHLPTKKLSLKEARETIKKMILSDDVYQTEVFEFAKKSLIEEIRQIYFELYSGKQPFTSFDHQLRWLDEYIKKKKVDEKYILKLKQCIHQYHQLLQSLQRNEEAILHLVEDYLDKILPSEAFVKGRFVYCSLNHHVKLSQKDIECWNEILKQVKESVLVVFLMFSYEPKANLLNYFDPEVRERIYFVGAASKWIHLHRLQGIDCILDSFYYGAHTSAGDAIWAQVPIITRLGEAMESRVCSSMLHAAYLDELICKDTEEYIRRAIECAHHSQFYHSCLMKLKSARSSPLFDQKSYIRHLTDGYQQAWENFCEGQPPSHIIVKQ